MTEQVVRAQPDPWAAKVPKAVHISLSVLTLGAWTIVWRKPVKLWLPAVLGGVLLTTSFAGFDIWPFGFLFPIPLLWLAERTGSAKRAFMWGWLAGWVGQYGGFYWIGGLLEDFGHLPMPVATLLCMLLMVQQGASFAVFCALIYAVRKRRSVPMVVAAPIVWCGIELVYPGIFPAYMGNSQYNFAPMIQVAELLGPIGVSAFLFIGAGALYDIANALWLDPKEGPEKKRALIGSVIGFALIAANITYGVVRIGQVEAQEAAAETLRIGMVEADIGIWEKESPDKIANNLVIHQNLSKKLADEENVDLIVWPESSFHSRYIYASTEKTEDLKRLEQTTKRYVRYIPKDATYLRPSKAPLIGDVTEDEKLNTPLQDRYGVQRGFTTPTVFGGITIRHLSPEEMATNPPAKKTRYLDENGELKTKPRPYRVSNSAVFVDEVGKVRGMYDKNYLLVFGEYIPGSQHFPWIFDLIPEASDFTPGDTVELFPFKGHNLGMMICYEDIIPAFGRKLASKQPDVIINITNDAWFGKTNEPYLHMALATFRAVESRRWLLRSTNTGVSVFVDASGRIVKQTSIYEPETLVHDVPMLKGEPTLYVRIGDVIGYAGLLGIGVLLFWRRKETAPVVSESSEAEG